MAPITAVGFANLAVEGEGAQLKEEINGPGSKISDFSLELFTRWIRLGVCSFSPLFLRESGLRVYLPGVRDSALHISREVHRGQNTAAQPLPAVRHVTALL